MTAGCSASEARRCGQTLPPSATFQPAGYVRPRRKKGNEHDGSLRARWPPPPPPRGHPGSRRDAGDGGAVLQHAARRSRSGCHQDRAAGHGRPDARRHGVQDEGARQHGLPQHEPEQAQRCPEPQIRCGARPSSRYGRHCGRAGRELPTRRHGTPRPRIRGDARPQSGTDLCEHLGLRPVRPLGEAPRLRPDGRRRCRGS